MKQEQRLNAPLYASASERGKKGAGGGAEQRKAGAELKAEDAALWRRVAETVKPLARARRARKKREQAAGLAAAAAQTDAGGAARPPAPEMPRQEKPAKISPQAPAAKAPAAPRAAAKVSPLPRSNFETAAYKRLARGALPIEARLDLHGLTQAQAHDALLHFIRARQERGCRHVLVITGRGRSPGSEGVLQRQVPHWLAQAPFRLYVSGLAAAARPHGGAGAFYLRLRRKK